MTRQNASGTQKPVLELRTGRITDHVSTGPRLSSRQEFEEYLLRDRRARIINRVLRVTRILVETLALVLTIPAAIIQLIAVCYMVYPARTLDWAHRHTSQLSHCAPVLPLFAYFWNLTFAFSTYPRIARRFPDHWEYNLIAGGLLLLVLLPFIIGLDVFARLVETSQD